MSEYYEIDIAGVKRKLERFSVSDKMDIAAFILFGDVEVTVAASEELIKKLPEFDVIFTPEAKSIPLAYEMSRQTGKPYVVGRKGQKVYMRNPIVVEVQSITTKNIQRLCIGESEVEKIRGKRV
ncbi:MAG: adenine phosphoribosyltransferase, partial [Acutalibacteraceae bacterium]